MANQNVPTSLGKEYADAMERENFLRDNADAVQSKTYMRRFSPEEMQEHKEVLADLMIEINKIEDEKAGVMAEFKERLKPLTEKRNEALENIKNKAILVTEDCFKFVDREQRITIFYNKEGDLVESRPCTADEMQETIFTPLRKTGTEG